MYLWSALGLLLEEIIFLLCPKIPTLRKANNIFLLCPDSYFAHRQFRNRTVQSRNSYFVRQSENSYFAQVQFRNCTNSYSAQNIYILSFSSVNLTTVTDCHQATPHSGTIREYHNTRNENMCKNPSYHSKTGFT